MSTFIKINDIEDKWYLTLKVKVSKKSVPSNAYYMYYYFFFKWPFPNLLNQLLQALISVSFIDYLLNIVWHTSLPLFSGFSDFDWDLCRYQPALKNILGQTLFKKFMEGKRYVLYQWWNFLYLQKIQCNFIFHINVLFTDVHTTNLNNITVYFIVPLQIFFMQNYNELTWYSI